MTYKKQVRVFSMFTGIGGFEVGIENSYIKHKMVGFSELDKYAIEIFSKHFKGIKNYEDATRIDETKLPDFDLLVGGFPCQAFSVAGNLRGFDDTRGTLFFDIARILGHKKPKHFILENVRGLLSHGSGRTFQRIIEVLTNLGYLVEWEVLNSKNYGVPQNRERVYIIGHLRGQSRPKVFPIRKSEEVSDSSREEKRKVGSTLSSTITSNYKKGVHALNEQYIMEPREITKNQSMAYRVYKSDGVSTTLKAVGGGVGAKTGLYEVSACLTPERKDKRQNGRRFKDNEEPMFTLTGQDRHGVMINEATKKGYAVAEEGDSINAAVPTSKTRRGRVGKKIAQTLDTGMQQHTLQRSVIRRLTPTECERLQGFPDGWTEGISDTQRYKCLGNAVTTNVITGIINRLYKKT